MLIRRLTPRQFLLALLLTGALLGGVAATVYVMDLRQQAAVRAEDVFTAVGQGDMTRVIECLKAKPELANARDAKGRTPLHLAAEKNLADTTRLLLSMGADRTLKDAAGKTAAEVAADKGASGAAAILREGR